VAVDDVSLSSSAEPVLHPAIPINIPGAVTPAGEAAESGGMMQVEMAEIMQVPDPPLPLDPQAVARVTASLPRQTILQSLQADPVLGAQLQACGPLLAPGTTGAGAMQTYSGALEGPTSHRAPAAPTSTSQIDWASGVTITPLQDGDLFAEGAHTYTVGTMWVCGVNQPPRVLKQKDDQHRVVRLDEDSRAYVYADVPDGPGTYAITIRLTDHTGYAHPGWLPTAQNDSTALKAFVGYGSAGYQQLPLVRLSDGSGFTGLLSDWPSVGSYLSSWAGHYGMKRINKRLDLYLYWPPDMTWEQFEYYLFGGVTITKLN
jgi:hypothetical protein